MGNIRKLTVLLCWYVNRLVLVIVHSLKIKRLKEEKNIWKPSVIIKWSIIKWSVLTRVSVLFQCCTWRGVGSTAGGVLRSHSLVQRRPCVSTGSAASESSSPLSVRFITNTHWLTCLWLLPETRSDIVVFFSQQTQTPTGLYQPVRWEATGQTHLRAKGCTAVRPGRHLHSRHRYVPYYPLPVLGLPVLVFITCKAYCVCVVVIVTEYANYARDHLRTEAELKKFDGWGSLHYCNYTTEHMVNISK